MAVCHACVHPKIPGRHGHRNRSCWAWGCTWCDSGCTRATSSRATPQDSIDIINAVFDRFPLMVGITCTLVLLVMGASFQSVLIPLRSIVTIALSLMFTFGFANLTFVHHNGCGVR